MKQLFYSRKKVNLVIRAKIVIEICCILKPQTLKRSQMKRLITLSYILLLLIAFSSCDKKNATDDYYTTMLMEIPVAVEDTALTAESVLLGYPFSELRTESLNDNNILIDNFDLVRRIDVNEVNVEFSGIQLNQIIEQTEIYIENIGVITTIEDITSTNLNFTPAVNSSVLIQIANELYLNKQLTVTVSGTTNVAPSNFNVIIFFDLHIETSTL